MNDWIIQLEYDPDKRSGKSLMKSSNKDFNLRIKPDEPTS